MVFRRRGGLGLRPINSNKAIIDGTFLTVGAGITTRVVVATTVDDFTGATTEVPTGAKITSVYFFISIQQQAVNSNVDFYITKRPGSIRDTDMPVPGATGGSPYRKYILHEEKGLPGPSNNGSPPHIFRGVIRIPRGRQRMGETDEIQIVARGAAAYDLCIKAIYKYYR